MKAGGGTWARLLSLTGLLGWIVLASGCGGGSAEEEAGILRVGNGPEPKSLDAHLSTGIGAMQIQFALWEGLVRPERDSLRPRPAVAASWEASADGREYRFILREEAVWSDGAAVTAADFVAGWRRALHPERTTPYAEMLYVLENAEAYHSGEVGGESLGVRAVGRKELEVRLARPVPYFLSLLLHPVWFPIPAHVAMAGGAMAGGAAGSWTRPESFVGNGAFRLVRHLPNQLVEVVRNERYREAEEVALEGIRFYAFSEPAAEERAFLAGQLDVTDALPAGRVAYYEERHPEWLVVEPYLGTYYLLLNTREGPLADVRVRRALALALDREMLVESLLGAGQQAAGGFVPPGIAGYGEGFPVERDVAGARRLLREAGYGEGSAFPELEYLFNTSESHKRIAEAIQEMWRVELGISVQLTNQEWKTYLQRREQGDFEVARAVWIGDYVEPSTFLDLWRGENWSGWRSERYDALLREAQTEPDRKRRYELYAEAERLLLGEQVIIPLYHYVAVYLKRPRVENWAGNLLDWPVWTEVRLPSTE